MSKVTIVDIANKAGVSFKTVSRVLNRHTSVGEELRERVQAAMRELDYRPNRAARSLKGSRNFVLGFLMGTHASLDQEEVYAASSAYFAEVQRGILRACHDADYGLAVEWIDVGSKSLAADLRRHVRNLRVDGLVLAPPLVDVRAALDTLDSLGIPYARIAPGLDPGRSFAVGIDDRAAAYEMTRRLQALGHKRIAFVAGRTGHIAAGNRLTGYQQAVREAGEGEPIVASGDFTFAAGMDAGADLLRHPARPTAIFAANDEMAAGILAAAHLADVRVPEQLSVAGFDNAAGARLAWPSLTTVHQPVAAMSAAATEHLIDASMRQTALECLQVQLPFEIIERRSTARPSE